jgi:hypothetical protein
VVEEANVLIGIFASISFFHHTPASCFFIFFLCVFVLFVNICNLRSHIASCKIVHRFYSI